MSALSSPFDRMYRRVRFGSEEYQLLEEAWRSFDGTWEGLAILLRHQTPDGWVVFGFSLENSPPEEVVDLLIGEPCNQVGSPLGT